MYVLAGATDHLQWDPMAGIMMERIEPMSSLLFACKSELINFARLKDFQSPAFLSSLPFCASVTAHIVLMRAAACDELSERKSGRNTRENRRHCMQNPKKLVRLSTWAWPASRARLKFLFFLRKNLNIQSRSLRLYDALFRLLNVDLRRWIISRKDFINGAERLIKKREANSPVGVRSHLRRKFFAPIRLSARLNVFLKQHQTRSWELTVKALKIWYRERE